MTKKPGKTKKNFWDQPAIERPLPGKTYTRFVRSMRLLLPLVAMAMLAVVVAWPRMEDTIEEVPEALTAMPDVEKNELINPRFESEDSRKQPFTVTASRAVQSAKDPDLVLLDEPVADMMLKNGRWLAAEADSGAFRQEAEKLTLTGHVKLFHDAGYEIHTEKLFLDVKKEEAWTDVAVYGQGPAGTLSATGARIAADQQTLIFTGPAKLILNQQIEGLNP